MTDRRDYIDYLEDIRHAAEKAISFLGQMSVTDFAADDK